MDGLGWVMGWGDEDGGFFFFIFLVFEINFYFYFFLGGQDSNRLGSGFWGLVCGAVVRIWDLMIDLQRIFLYWV